MMIKWGENYEEVMEYIEATTDNYGDILVILSGGMDSATCLAIANRLRPDKVTALTFDYGQPHDKEIIKARELGWHYKTDVRTIDLNGLADNFKTALKKDSDIGIPDHAIDGIPPTYVPFRNTIMLSIALGYAESWGYQHIFFGANIIDYSGYPDCRPEYVDAMNMLPYVHNVKIEIEAPIIYLSKGDVVKLGEKLKVPWEQTWSCYRGEHQACGKCPSCQYRLKGFKEANVQDPLIYQH